MSIWLFEQEYHCEDFEQNKYRVSLNKRNYQIKWIIRNCLLVIQQEQRQLLRREEYVFQTIELLLEDNLP
jgi:hypothetical protein